MVDCEGDTTRGRAQGHLGPTARAKEVVGTGRLRFEAAMWRAIAAGRDVARTSRDVGCLAAAALRQGSSRTAAWWAAAAADASLRASGAPSDALGAYSEGSAGVAQDMTSRECIARRSQGWLRRGLCDGASAESSSSGSGGDKPAAAGGDEDMDDDVYDNMNLYERVEEFRMVPSEKVVRIAQDIEGMSLLEVAELTKLLKDRLGVDEAMLSPGAGGAGPPGAGDGADGAASKDKDAFDVKLEGFDAKSKLKVIKEVRAITGLGLKEAKELVEKSSGGSEDVKTGVSKEEAEAIAEQLKGVGATVTVK